MPVGKLPTRTIAASFYGVFSRWSELWEQFDHMIIRNGDLTLAQKFHYQKLFLKGAAASTIASLPTTEACYVDAVSVLKKRFVDKTRLEQEYFSRRRMLTPIRSPTDTAAFRKLHEQVLTSIRGLEFLGVTKKKKEGVVFCDDFCHSPPDAPWCTSHAVPQLMCN
ncbi:hypothetical protein V5799_003136 [Amblyomma americanum]|uniref:Tick transposon n=1 Tax=Amblyomma americanum TaxID=6943 RepID=A0AAQ4D9U3_AMBAM